MKTYSSFDEWFNETLGKRLDSTTLIVHDHTNEIKPILKKAWQAAIASLEVSHEAKLAALGQEVFKLKASLETLEQGKRLAKWQIEKMQIKDPNDI